MSRHNIGAPETWDESLTDCPDCNSDVVYCHPEQDRPSLIVCEDRCGFKGFEEYRLIQTVRTGFGEEKQEKEKELERREKSSELHRYTDE
jgi:hypothetical protein